MKSQIKPRPIKINLLLNIGVCCLLLGGSGQAVAEPGGRNPFALPAGVRKGTPAMKQEGGVSEKEGQPVTPAFRVTTILITGQTRVAAINGTLLRTGDALEGYRVEAIDDRQVVLGRGKERLVLHIDSGARYSFKKKNQDNRLMGSSK
jgi:hypothetical protein